MRTFALSLPLRAALAVCTLVLFPSFSSLATETALDDLYCVTVQDPAALGVPQAPPTSADCRVVGGATLACTPARTTINGTAESDRSGETLLFDRLCYKVECGDAPEDTSSSVMRDRLGDHDVTRSSADMVCTPAVFTLSDEAKKQIDGSGAAAVPGGRNNANAATCGDVNEDGHFSASDALAVLKSAVAGGAGCLICICDVDNTATITATDALKLLKFAVGQPIALNCQADGAPIVWDGGGDGISWTDPQNWDLNRIPNACDDAQISTANTVTHSTGSNAVHNILADAPFDITGGTLTLRGSATISGLFHTRGGTLANASVLVPGNNAPLVATAAGGTLDNVTMEADMDLTATSSYVYLANNFTLNGKATAGQGSGLWFNAGTPQLLGNGEVQLNGSGSQIYTYVPLTIGPDILIHGGNGSSVGGQGALTLNGTVDCDVTSTILYIGNYANWTNSGTIGAHNGCTAQLGSTWANTGTLALDTASAFNLGGTFASNQLGTISRTGGTINLTGQMNNSGTFTLNATTGDWRMVGGKIVGGTVDSADGAKLFYTSSGGTLDNVTMEADMDLTATSSYVYLANTFTLNGKATAGQGSGLWFNAGTPQLLGNGEVQLNGSGSQVYTYVPLTIGPDILIHGGNNSSVGGQGALTLNGTIDCDIASTILYIGNYANWTNSGTIGAHNGCTAQLGSTWANTGTLALDTTSAFNLGGTFASNQLGTISRTGGTINLTGQMNNSGTFTLNATTGDWRMVGGKIVGGTVDSADGAKLFYTSSGGTLDNVTMEADMDLTATSSYVYLANTFTLNGKATAGQGSGLWFNAGTPQLLGNGEVQLNGSGSQVYTYVPLTIGPDILIHGGNNSSVGGQGALTLNGTIDCDIASTILYIGNYANWTNSGTIGAHNGCTAQLGSTWANTGTLALDTTSAFNLGGTFASNQLGTISRTGGTINLTGQMNNSGTFTLNATTGDWRMVGGKIVGGTVDSADGAKLFYTSSGGTLDNVTMEADMDLTATSSYVYLANTFTLNGKATAGQGAGLWFNTGTPQFLGNGEVQLNGSGSQIYTYVPLTIGPDILIHGGNGSSVGGQGTITMNGTIDADAAGILYVGNSANWTNTGTLRASGGNLSTANAWSNSGSIEIGAGRALAATSGLTLNGGGDLTVDIAGTGTSNFGTVTVTGAAALGGTLNIVLTNGYVPNIGDTFQIMTYGSSTGSFATVNGTAIAAGKAFAVTIDATSITLEVVAG